MTSQAKNSRNAAALNRISVATGSAIVACCCGSRCISIAVHPRGMVMKKFCKCQRGNMIGHDHHLLGRERGKTRVAYKIPSSLFCHPDLVRRDLDQ